MLDALNPRSVLFRSLISNPGTQVPLDRERIYARELEIPSGGGVGTARAIAKAYGVFAGDGHELGLRPETLAALRAPAIPPRRGFHDECMSGEVQFSLGFMKPTPTWPFGHPGAFGAPGAGGSLGYADPATGIGYAYVTNRMGRFDGDPRDVALRRAMPLLAAGASRELRATHGCRPAVLRRRPAHTPGLSRKADQVPSTPMRPRGLMPSVSAIAQMLSRLMSSPAAAEPLR